MSLNKQGLSIISVLVIILFAGALSVLNIPSSEAQQAPQCPEKKFTCWRMESVRNYDKEVAMTKAKTSCTTELHKCEQEKTAACVRYCLENQCSGGSITVPPSACGDAACKTETETTTSSDTFNFWGLFGHSRGRSMSVNIHTCTSEGTSTVLCKCGESTTTGGQ